MNKNPEHRFRETRARTEALAAPLSAEDMVVQSMPDVSPTKWHLGHTSWFFETFILKTFATGYKEFDADYCYLFNSYYNAVGKRHARPRRGMLTRPPLDRVMAYRQHVTGAMLGLLKAAGGDGQDRAKIAPLLELGCHHEEQHQELLLTDIKHVLYQNPLKPAYADAPATRRKVEKLTWKAFAEGVVEIGCDGAGFAFDCEGPRHKVYLPGFEIAERPVTNGEYLEFIKDKGYQTFGLWLSDGWTLINETEQDCPLYWTRRDEEWREFTLRGEHPLNPGAPVCHLSYYEADAYARWAGARLPTEAEHEILTVNQGIAEPGEVWQWTSSAYSPYPGFKAAPGAVGEYNGKFMVNQMVLRGGSGATAPGHWRPTYRNFFFPPDSWQFTGARLARDL